MSTPAQQSTASDAGGQAVIFGDYEIGTRLERRASADVYEARHIPTGGRRLLYVLRPGAMENHPFVHQVICEVDAARWLRHACTAKVDGYGDTPSMRLYVAAERPGGRSLGELLESGARFAPRQVVRFAHRLVEALEEAHAVGLVHGRLTPDVLIVADDEDGAGSPQVTLLGLGTAAVALDGELTELDRLYVSPEQQAGGEADERSDVFGLASLLHHALVGSPPPPSGSDTVAALLPAEHASALEVLAAARATDPKARPATVKAFWVDLLAALVDAGASDPVRTPAGDRRAVTPPATLPVYAEPAAQVMAPWRASEPDRSLVPMGILTSVAVSAPSAPTPAAPAPVAPAPVAAARAEVPAVPELPELLDIEPAAPARAREVEEQAELPPTAATTTSARPRTAVSPTIAAPRRRRGRLMHALLLVLVAAATAAVWPSGPGGAHQLDERIIEDTLLTVRWEPDDEPAASQAPLPTPLAVPVADSAPAPVRRRPRVNVPEPIALPDVQLPTAESAPLVRPEDFKHGIAKTGGSQ